MDEQDISDDLEQSWDADEIRRMLERSSANTRFWEENRSSFLAQYPNKWIAIFDQEIVAVSKNQAGLKRQLKRKEIDSALCLWEFLDPDPESKILSAQGSLCAF